MLKSLSFRDTDWTIYRWKCIKSGICFQNYGGRGISDWENGQSKVYKLFVPKLVGPIIPVSLLLHSPYFTKENP